MNWPGSNGPSRRSVSVEAATQAAIAHPTLRARSDRNGSTRSSSGSGRIGGCTTAGSSAPTVPGSGYAERWSEPSGLSSRGTHSPPPAARAASRASEPSSSSQSGLRRTVTGCSARSTPTLLAAPNPGLSPSSTTSAPAARASAGPSSDDAVSTTISCGGEGSRPSEASSAGSGPAESWSTTTMENGVTPPPPARRGCAGRSRPR